MARLPRLVLPGLPHHIIQRGNNRQAIFIDDKDREYFLATLRESALTHQVAIHAYVLMDNHVHLLVTPQQVDGLSRMMQSLGRRYVGWFNHRHGRSGTLWEGRFRAALIEGERYLLTCARYIELNPLRAGTWGDAGAYLWSSCAHHLGRRRDPLVTEHPMYWALGNTPFEREAAYRELLEQGLSDEEVGAVTASALKGWPLGSAGFLQGLAAQIDRPMAPRSRGRPRKHAADSVPN
ncbi:transposase [Paucibacter sp. PLA-PC-4]|uniref:transposase n=1 Tax=Paucibacter sp. PLA-PC-4 TaxID=2993655 RepID=UPI002248AA4D|nr:transposase [Paucibacter sp. PLA-PC-4]MCX2861378.1 transposase [Paucibacter sp. PLA-PC-4]